MGELLHFPTREEKVKKVYEDLFKKTNLLELLREVAEEMYYQEKYGDLFIKMTVAMPTPVEHFNITLRKKDDEPKNSVG
jgi:hypothetical protein